MEHARVGFVRYLNTLPLVAGLEKVGGLEAIAAVPSHLADMLRDRRVDLALVSLIDAARDPDAFELLPVGAIACDGPTLTVRLFSSVPIEQIRTLHVDTDSHTSAVLAQVILNERAGAPPRLVHFHARERATLDGRESHADDTSEWPDSVLLIGDKVIADPPPEERYPHQLDLGQAWHEMTGLPFVYAVWMCRKGEAGSQKVRTGSALLDRQRRHNATRLERIAHDHAERHGWPADVARRYLTELLRFDVDERARRACDEFVSRASSMGLARGVVSWADPPGVGV